MAIDERIKAMFGSLESDGVTGGGDSAVDDPAYNAGADKIDNPITAGPDASREIADSLSQEDESILDGETHTTAWYKQQMKRKFGSLQ
jgi:hypothetical protein